MSGLETVSRPPVPASGTARMARHGSRLAGHGGESEADERGDRDAATGGLDAEGGVEGRGDEDAEEDRGHGQNLHGQ